MGRKPIDQQIEYTQIFFSMLDTRDIKGIHAPREIAEKFKLKKTNCIMKLKALIDLNLITKLDNKKHHYKGSTSEYRITLEGILKYIRENIFIKPGKFNINHCELIFELFYRSLEAVKHFRYYNNITLKELFTSIVEGIGQNKYKDYMLVKLPRGNTIEKRRLNQFCIDCYNKYFFDNKNRIISVTGYSMDEIKKNKKS